MQYSTAEVHQPDSVRQFLSVFPGRLHGVVQHSMINTSISDWTYNVAMWRHFVVDLICAIKHKLKRRKSGRYDGLVR